MRSFYAPTCKTDCLQILYKLCKNWISVPHQVKLSLCCKYCKIHRCSIFPDAINSIGPTLLSRDHATASQWRQSSMTSFDSSPFADARTWLSFLAVLGEFEPENVVGHRVDPKKALPYVRTRVLRHLAWNSMHRLLVLIFHVFRWALPYGRLVQILGYVFVSWSKFGHSHKNAMSLLTLLKLTFPPWLSIDIHFIEAKFLYRPHA